MVDIDDFLEGELASINEVLEQFQTDDKKAKQRIQTEEKMLESKNTTVGFVIVSMTKRRLRTSEWNCGRAIHLYSSSVASCFVLICHCSNKSLAI